MLNKTSYSLPNSAPFGLRLPIFRRLFNLHWDSWLFLFIAALLSLSAILLYSASGQKITIVIRHGIHVFFSFLVFLAIAQISPRTYKQWAPVLFAAGFIMLCMVLVFGTVSKGAQRWINLGFMRFQPSELMKLILPLMLAFYLSTKPIPLQKWPFVVSLLIIFVPGILIAKQPDLGTALLVIGTGLGVLFFAGIRMSWVIKLGSLAIAALPCLWWVLHDYQRQRVLTFLNPERDPLGSGYHIIQSKIAIGSGGIYGKGWCQGTQAQLNFLPERTTDFIFSVLAEEFGYIGVCVLCFLYFGVLVRCCYIMLQTTATFDRLVVSGVMFSLFLCFFINIGMVSGLLPVVGCPLPFISYGGTSLVTWMAALGMLVSIQSQQKLMPR